MQLTDLFDLSFIARSNEPALEIDAGTTLTFGEIDARANRMARALASRGVAAGDRVAVYLPNCLEFLDLFLASIRLGAIFTPINVLYREREIAHIVAGRGTTSCRGRPSQRGRRVSTGHAGGRASRSHGRGRSNALCRSTARN